ncbi:MAG TPA: alpha/beta fold hydrolase [Nitrospirota bacterium]|nr:alpha/beta fold hydrolase [Nitrospirota bacterium]
MRMCLFTAEDFTELAVHLSRRGYTVLLFDFRAHGESGGRRTSFGYHEQEDILAALDYLKTRDEVDPRRIGIYGFSLGGSSAILAAAKLDGFRAVVADSAFTSLRDQTKTAVTDFYHLPTFPFLPLVVFAYEVYFQTRVDAVSPVESIAMLSPTPVFIILGDGDRLIPPKMDGGCLQQRTSRRRFGSSPGLTTAAHLPRPATPMKRGLAVFLTSI